MIAFKTAGFALLLAFAAPAMAQEAPAPAAAPSQERLALARVTVDHLWPLGTYERMMHGTMSTMMDSVMESMFDIKASDVPYGGEEIDPADADKTMRELVSEADPHFEERMRITNQVMMGVMIPLMARVEPRVRDMLTRSYARKFDARQLGEMNAFFATPTGRAYAADAMMMFVDPEFTQVIAEFAPEMMQAMPAIMEKVEAATAHLPQPDLPAEADEAGDDAAF